MNILDELAQKYGADKWGKHHYTPVYYNMFKDRRENNIHSAYVTNMLEIGVAEGASLYMWHEFFPEAEIYGADNDPKRIFYQPPSIQVYKCDQSKEEDLEKLVKKTKPFLDLVIDDGSHKPQDQIFTCLKMMGELLAEGVTYVIEDVADVSIKDAFYHYDVQVVEVGQRYDDRLIIVKHKHE